MSLVAVVYRRMEGRKEELNTLLRTESDYFSRVVIKCKLKDHLITFLLTLAEKKLMVANKNEYEPKTSIN